MLPREESREPIRQAWRDIHEAVYYAANATKCAQFTEVADLRARRGDISGDLDALRCMQRLGRLVSNEARRYEDLHEHFTVLMRPGADAPADGEVAGFVGAVQELETQLWALVPLEQLPAGMFAPTNDTERGRLRLVRRSRRSGAFEQ